MLPATISGALVPTTSAGPVNRLTSLFDRFFDDDPFFAAATTTLPLSIWEDEGKVYVEVDAPGMDEADMEVSVHQGKLVIKGERQSQRKEGGWDTRSYGRFEQRIALPAPVEGNQAQARLAKGVLSITIPKSEAAKPRKISIKAD